MKSDDPEFEAWLDRARATPIEVCAERAGFVPGRGRGRGIERTGACPVCGGTDRFAVNVRKRTWNCRGCGRGGRDGLGILMHCLGVRFVEACEVATGEPPPKGERQGDPAARAKRLAEIEAERARREADQAALERDFREEERARARRLWLSRLPFEGSPAEDYLRARGLRIPPGRLRLGFAADLPLYAGRPGADGRPVELYRGPALLAPIVGPDGRFLGVHRTWFDPTRPGAKVMIVDPETGEESPAKKVLGLVRGGHIDLAGPAEPERLVAGEGIETVLSVETAFALRGDPRLEGTLFRSAVSLGNLAGRAAEGDRVAHPTRTRTDKLGRVFKVRVPGATPDPDDLAMSVPESVRELVLLGDGDSDRFETDLKLKRAAARHRRPGRRIVIAWAADGMDFNDMLRGGGLT